MRVAMALTYLGRHRQLRVVRMAIASRTRARWAMCAQCATHAVKCAHTRGDSPHSKWPYLPECTPGEVAGVQNNAAGTPVFAANRNKGGAYKRAFYFWHGDLIMALTRRRT